MSEMSGQTPTRKSGFASIAGRLRNLVAPPPCGICGRGHASVGWMVDPFGRASGRCAGCVEVSGLAESQAPLQRSKV